MPDLTPHEIVSAHSPDSDDAFMFYGLATKKIRSPKVNFHHVLSDIETLNRKAMEGVYDLSAISYHAYPYVADKYVLMSSGSSIREWAYAKPFETSNARHAAMHPWLHNYNTARPHSALGGKPPISRIKQDNVLGNDI